MAEKILQTELLVGPDHRLVVDLPPETSNRKVTVTVQSEERLTQPTNGERPIRREPPQEWQGKVTFPPSFFAPLSDEELKDWYGE